MTIYDKNGSILINDGIIPDGASVTLYYANGSVFASGLIVNDDSDREHELMGHDALVLRFSLAYDSDSIVLTFPSRCYCVFGGRKYMMFSAQPDATKKNRRQHDYVLTMYTAEYLLSITVMRDRHYSSGGGSYEGGSKTKFPLTASAREHLEYMTAVLNTADDSVLWKVDYSRCVGMVASETGAYTNYDGTKWDDTEDMRLVTYENVYCIDAIRDIAEKFGTEFEVEDVAYNGTTYHVLCLHNVEYYKSSPLSLHYGNDNGLEPGIIRRNQTEMPPLDRIYVQGGEQNIGEHYGQTKVDDEWTGEKSNTLMLPANVDDVRYDGEHLYIRVDIDGTAKQFYYDNVLRYSYGLYQAQMRYRDEITGTYVTSFDSILVSDFQYQDGTLKNADGWKQYTISEDRRNLSRVKIGDNATQIPYRETNVEGVFDGSEVYPMRVGRVAGVDEITEQDDENTYYDILDTATELVNGELDYKDMGVSGETMTVIFQDGMLAGREFNIQTIGDGTEAKPNCKVDVYTTPRSYRIPLCQSENDGVVMPSYPFVPAVGDHYIVFHCQLPDSYVLDAEMRMLWQAADYLYNKDDETYSFIGKVTPLYAYTNWTRFINPVSLYMEVGRYIKIAEPSLFGENGLSMRVTSIKQNVNDMYDIDLVLSNAPSNVFNWAKKLASAVREVVVRPPHWRPANNVLPTPTHGINESRQVSNIKDNTNYVEGSRRNALLPSINELAVGANDNDTLILALSQAIEEFNGQSEVQIEWRKCLDDQTGEVLKPGDYSGVCKAYKPVKILS